MAEEKPRPALDHSLLGAALANLRDSDAPWAEKSCMIFMAFTCTRSKEARESTWDEVGPDTSTWTIPASRMKTDTLHRVPLSTQAKELLAHARDHTDLSENRIFPLQRGDQYITNATLSKLLKKLEIATPPAGFRTSFRIWAGEQGNVSEPTAEMALAHRPTNRERELMTSDFLEERQALMQAWADYLTSTMGPVTPTTEE